MPSGIASELATYAKFKLRQNLAQIERCAAVLSHETFWQRATPRNNSVGNLALHLAGNVRQWVTGGIGGRAVQRDRQAEFDALAPMPAGQALAGLRIVVDEACEVLAGLTDQSLCERRVIQGYDVSVAVALMHVVEHFSWHTGQIVHMTKALSDADLSVYDSSGHRLDAALLLP